MGVVGDGAGEGKDCDYDAEKRVPCAYCVLQCSNNFFFPSMIFLIFSSNASTQKLKVAVAKLLYFCTSLSIKTSPPVRRLISWTLLPFITYSRDYHKTTPGKSFLSAAELFE
jgi:hypothetical protein